MTYLYAILGLLMMSGIVAIFNMSLKITSQPIESVIPANKYQENKFNLKDKIFLELLLKANESWGTGDSFCNKIIEEINNPNNNFNDIRNYNISDPSPSIHNKVVGSCTFSQGNHRVLIKPKNLDNSEHYFFSCFLVSKEKYCNLEKDK
tara:strand:+ start:333 stop:779 length:447 start_codon:yes stop_codon:yes gene_type:complete